VVLSGSASMIAEFSAKGLFGGGISSAYGILQKISVIDESKGL
jgi:hypothetical protein